MTRRGLTPRKQELLNCLAAYKLAGSKAPSHADLARLMACSKQNVTRLVKEMTEQGLIKRIAGKAHRHLVVPHG